MNKTLYILLAIFNFSCTCFLYKNFNYQKSTLENIRILKNKEKEIIYLPTVHYSEKQDLDEIKNFVNTKRQEGYKIYYETVFFNKKLDSLVLDTLQRKYRKLAGKENGEESLPKCITKYEKQTLENTGINKDTDFNADLNVQELIYKIEKKYGKIKLSDCDWETQLDESYKCKTPKNSIHVLAHEFRDEYLISQLINSDDNKIVLLYGKAHWLQAIYPKLVYKNGYTLVKGKL